MENFHIVASLVLGNLGKFLGNSTNLSSLFLQPFPGFLSAPVASTNKSRMSELLTTTRILHLSFHHWEDISNGTNNSWQLQARSTSLNILLNHHSVWKLGSPSMQLACYRLTSSHLFSFHREAELGKSLVITSHRMNWLSMRVTKLPRRYIIHRTC